jgi:hypothetical protein
MSAGIVSAAALCASGLAGVFIPDEVGKALELIPTTARAKTEVRAGLGGTYAALGGWALLDRSPAADRAVGFTWLGAAGVRIASMVVDRPRKASGRRPSPAVAGLPSDTGRARYPAPLRILECP